MLVPENPSEEVAVPVQQQAEAPTVKAEVVDEVISQSPSVMSEVIETVLPAAAAATPVPSVDSLARGIASELCTRSSRRPPSPPTGSPGRASPAPRPRLRPPPSSPRAYTSLHLTARPRTTTSRPLPCGTRLRLLRQPSSVRLTRVRSATSPARHLSWPRLSLSLFSKRRSRSRPSPPRRHRLLWLQLPSAVAARPTLQWRPSSPLPSTTARTPASLRLAAAFP
jgi:hypothetical protein